MSTAAPPSSRREFIARRRQRSLAWRIIHALGSLRLALLLLATIGLACAIATFAESRFDSKVAQAWIYRAPWFVVWLGVLCVNLFAVTLTRWPWQRHHLGFIVTHYGIILLLVGAMIGSHFGFEGNVTLHRGAPPLDRVTTSRSLLQIGDGRSGGFFSAPFDAALKRPRESRPAVFDVPGSSLQLVVDDHSDRLGWSQRLVPDPSPGAPPGVTLNFSSAMMGQNLSLPLLLENGRRAERDFFGLARVALASELPARPPIGITESQIVFARFAPVVQSPEQATTGIHAELSADGATLNVALPDGKRAAFDRANVVGKPQSLGSARLTVAEYWPDFALVDGRPTTASDQPKNPAVLLRIEAPRQIEPGKDARPQLEVSPSAEGLAYQLGRGEFLVSAGKARVGETFPLGWADWTVTVAESRPHARLESRREPVAQGLPGLRAHLRAADGRTGPPVWIASGDMATLSLGGDTVDVGYGLESRPVPFGIRLKNFEVPRLEGTDTPANFIATVEFRDAKGGPWREDVAQMNHPASFPGGAFAVTTGLNYKFSQAQWNPDNLGETTLQVLYDPGWLLKWTGSLAICAGIFIMFYLRPRKA